MQHLMTRLKLARVREVYESWLERAAQDSLSYRDFLEGLLHEEILAREENQLLTDEQLNKLGELGLELVGILPISHEVTEVGRTWTKHTVHYFFKRPKPQTPGR